jgi:hypothetical protein
MPKSLALAHWQAEALPVVASKARLLFKLVLVQLLQLEVLVVALLVPLLLVVIVQVVVPTSTSRETRTELEFKFSTRAGVLAICLGTPPGASGGRAGNCLPVLV